MGRKKRVPLNPWETAHTTREDGHYIRLGDSFLESKAVQGLSHAAFRVLIQMIKACAGKPEFNFSRSYYESKCGLPHSTVIRSIAELEGKGFIKVNHERYSNRPNSYSWSDAWKITR